MNGTPMIGETGIIKKDDHYIVGLEALAVVRFCSAGGYEFGEGEDGGIMLHLQVMDMKDPSELSLAKFILPLEQARYLGEWLTDAIPKADHNNNRRKED